MKSLKLIPFAEPANLNLAILLQRRLARDAAPTLLIIDVRAVSGVGACEILGKSLYHGPAVRSN